MSAGRAVRSARARRREGAALAEGQAAGRGARVSAGRLGGGGEARAARVRAETANETGGGARVRSFGRVRRLRRARGLSPAARAAQLRRAVRHRPHGAARGARRSCGRAHARLAAAAPGLSHIAPLLLVLTQPPVAHAPSRVRAHGGV
jgi:hypothetical protein